LVKLKIHKMTSGQQMEQGVRGYVVKVSF